MRSIARNIKKSWKRRINYDVEINLDRRVKKTKQSKLDIAFSFITTVAIIWIDRTTKLFVLRLLSYGESLPIKRNIFHLTLQYNTGIAFGLFKGHGFVFIVVPIIVIILLIFNIYYYKYNNEALSRPYIFGFSLILGGAIGNLIDRVVYGHVIDFLDFRIWPIFNVADSAITVGATIIAIKCFQLSAK